MATPCLISEVLCFLNNRMDSNVAPVIMKACSDFYDLQEVEDAKAKLLSVLDPALVPATVRASRSGAVKKDKVVEDVYKLMQVAPTALRASIVLKDLNRVPVIGLQGLDYASLLKGHEALKADVDALKAQVLLLVEEATSKKTAASVLDADFPPLVGDCPGKSFAGAASVPKPLGPQGTQSTQLQQKPKVPTVKVGHLGSRPSMSVRFRDSSERPQAPEGEWHKVEKRRRRKAVVGACPKEKDHGALAKRVKVPVRTIFMSRLPSDAEEEEVKDLVTSCLDDLPGVEVLQPERVKARYDSYSSFKIPFRASAPTSAVLNASRWPDGLLLHLWRTGPPKEDLRDPAVVPVKPLVDSALAVTKGRGLGDSLPGASGLVRSSSGSSLNSEGFASAES